MARKFPSTIYVTREGEGTNDEYLSVHTDADSAEFEQSTVVAVYDFVSMGRVEVKREFRFGSLAAAQKATLRRSAARRRAP